MTDGDPTADRPDAPETRIARALHYAGEYGYIDGAHHKQWVIDQMVRALTGCPYVDREAVDYRGGEYTLRAQGESAEYTEWLGADDEFDAGDWAGIAP